MDDAEAELVRLMDEMEHNLSELRRLLIELGCDVPARTPWHPSLPGFTPQDPTRDRFKHELEGFKTRPAWTATCVECDEPIYHNFGEPFTDPPKHQRCGTVVWLGDGPAA